MVAMAESSTAYGFQDVSAPPPPHNTNIRKRRIFNRGEEEENMCGLVSLLIDGGGHFESFEGASETLRQIVIKSKPDQTETKLSTLGVEGLTG